MSRIVQEPTERQGDRHSDKVLEHPAFGQISLSRITGTRTLYDSDFKHRHFVRITIRHSELHRGLSRDWHFARGEVASVNLSEAQWATFVSSFGLGNGVPCTIDSIAGKHVPEFPLRDEGQEFKAEADSKLAESVQALDAAIAAVTENTIGLTKTKAAALLEPLKRARMQIAQNLPFVAQQFGEHMEARVEKAKVEVNAYMTATLVHAGLEKLTSDAPLLLEDKAGAGQQ